MSNASGRTQPMNLAPGDTLGSYVIERELGRGGMADVYYGVHRGLNRAAAIKILRPEFAQDEIHLQRFHQEARAAASLIHPNIVQVYDVGQSGDLWFIAQEYVAGSNLRQYLVGNGNSVATTARNDSLAATVGIPGLLVGTDGDNNHATPTDPSRSDPHVLAQQLKVRECLSILLQILAALEKSASLGIVHRDIKPENIMLTENGDVKVADFGLARMLMGDDPQLTRAGTTLGTPMYMSPEQIQEGCVDIRSDLYSLGVTLFHMLAGEPPFRGETPLALAMQHVQTPAPDIRTYRQDLPGSIVYLVDKLLHKDPAERFRSPTDVLEFLRGERTASLQEFWPDTATPLPRVAYCSSNGPMAATIQLQTALAMARSNRNRRVVAWIACGVASICAFAATAYWNYHAPDQLITPSNNLYQGIAKQPTAQEQYRWALLDESASRIAKWEAVRYFYPSSNSVEATSSSLSRLYTGLATIQLARARMDAGDAEQARNLLKDLSTNNSSPELVRALAFLQLANIEVELHNDNAAYADVEEAIQISNRPSFSYRDREHLRIAIASMSEKIQTRWKEGMK